MNTASKFYYCSAIFFIFLSGCQKVEIANDFFQVKRQAKDMTGHDVVLLSSVELSSHVESCEKFDQPLSRDRAIGLALLNNVALQSRFEKIGITRADLQQAGFYTNPTIQGVFLPPLQDSQMEFEVGISFDIADLWQVPLKKKVARDVLQMATFDILGVVLQTVQEARMAYDDVLIAQQKVSFAEEVAKQGVDLHDDMQYRQEFGLSGELDKSFAKVMASNGRLEVIRAQNELSRAYLNLRQLMGVEPSSLPIVLAESFEASVKFLGKGLPIVSELKTYALTRHPEILNAQMNIKRYKDSLALEKTRIFKSIKAGVSFKREFGGDRGVGPNIEMSLPLFDQNQAQATHFEFLIKQAQKDLISLKLEIQKEVDRHYLDFIAHVKELQTYVNELLPAAESAFEYTKKFQPIMQITMVTLIQTKMALYQNKMRALGVYHAALNAFSRLEKSVGRRIDFDEIG